MVWFIITLIFSTLLDIVRIGRLSDQEKELEIIILRHQLDILARKQKKPVNPSQAEKLTLAILTNKLKQSTGRTTNQLKTVIRLFQPATVLKWHRQLVRRKWTQDNKGHAGRPKISQDTEKLVLRLAQENGRWGYGKIEGELKKLGIKISLTSIRNILNRHGIVPAPVRYGSIGWRQLMNHYKDQMLACDFFTVETIWLKTLYVFFFIELGTRRVHLAGITTHPNSDWVAQQARHFVWQIEGSETNFRFLLRDRDSKYSSVFDHLFESEGMHVIPTPLRAPNANAFAERWVRTVREECLDHLLILNEKHLHRVLLEFINYYETARPHQGLGQQTPIPCPEATGTGQIQTRKVLGGIINDYYRSQLAISHVS